MDTRPITLEQLPPDIVQEIISQAGDFSSIVWLYNNLKTARGVLTVNTTRDPYLGKFLQEKYAPTGSQDAFLSSLARKFRLRIRSPIAFPKLIRVYNRRQDCTAYLALNVCIFQAGKRDESWEKLLDKWKEQYARISISLKRYMVFLPAVETSTAYRLLIDKLITVTSKRGHLDSIHELILDSANYQAWYYYLRAHVRLASLPYKVKTTREIRQEYAATLYNPDIDTDTKRSIWASKYDFQGRDPGVVALEHIANANIPNMVDIFLDCFLAKFAIPRSPGLPSLTFLFSCQSGNLTVIRQLLRSMGGQADNQLSVVSLIKRGYFDILRATQVSEIRISSQCNVWNKNKHVSDYLRKFSLTELELLNTGLSNVYSYPNLSKVVLLSTILSNMPRVYEEYVRRYKPNISEYYAVFTLNYQAKLSGVSILNNLLAETYNFLGVEDRQRILQDWFPRNSKLLCKIWTEYGRRQWEDCVLYLKVHYNVQVTAKMLYPSIVKTSCLGLLAYIFGLELRSGYPEYKLEPLTNGLIAIDRELIGDIPVASIDVIAVMINIETILDRK